MIVNKAWMRWVAAASCCFFSPYDQGTHGTGKTGKMAKKKSLSGKTQGIGKFDQNTGKTHGILSKHRENTGILLAQVVNVQFFYRPSSALFSWSST